ncbi:unnamed protein product [Camellia sinensis]
MVPSESATDTITQSQPMSIAQTLISSGQVFELGFFTPGNSSNLYIGIWYKNIPARRVLWVLNRENPIPASDNASSLTIGSDGNLRLLDGKRNTVWSTNVSVPSNKTIAVLSDNGDFVLEDNATGWISWESFKYPSDTFLSGMMIGFNNNTGEKRFLSSWKTDDNPSPSKYVLGLTQDAPPQVIFWNDSKPTWIGGPWDGWKFIGIPDRGQGYSNGLNVIQDTQQQSVFLSFNMYNTSGVTIIVVTPEGIVKTMVWVEQTKSWYVNYVAPANPCDVYGYCGPNVFWLCLAGLPPLKELEEVTVDVEFEWAAVRKCSCHGHEGEGSCLMQRIRRAVKARLPPAGKRRTPRTPRSLTLL